jgi:hypothetical protein
MTEDTDGYVGATLWRVLLAGLIVIVAVLGLLRAVPTAEGAGTSAALTRAAVCLSV